MLRERRAPVGALYREVNPVKKYYVYRAASAAAAIFTLVVASGAGWKW